jgi:(p)ppGpp synthase/HD superfamily hydrolase
MAGFLFSPDRYLDALQFAAEKHLPQKFPGKELPYLVHVVTVAAEVTAHLPALGLDDPDLAVTCALLHDTIEDTDATYEDVAARFGAAVADGVAALSKDPSLPKADQMQDSFRRIRQQPREVWVVKLADRIANMDTPPHYWTLPKRQAYREEALLIAATLGPGAPVLEARLRERIAAYPAP